MYTRFRTKLSEREEGFTLIELLVVIIIIGILAAIAIPVFLSQRDKAYQKAVDSDTRSSGLIGEAYYTDNNTYAPSGAGPAAALAATFTVSTNDIVMYWGTATTYCLVAAGKGKAAYVTQNSGGVQELGTVADATAAAVAANAADAANCTGVAPPANGAGTATRGTYVA